MTLKDKLMDDLKESMKNKEQVRKSVVTLIRSAVKQKEVDEKSRTLWWRCFSNYSQTS